MLILITRQENTSFIIQREKEHTRKRVKHFLTTFQGLKMLLKWLKYILKWFQQKLSSYGHELQNRIQNFQKTREEECGQDDYSVPEDMYGVVL